MKFIRGKEGQIINVESVEIIDIVGDNGKYEVQAKLSEFSVVLADFEHMDHAKAFLDKLWVEEIRV
jgi:putative IMPACT (imprinted ancient) family translation regulator